MDYKDEPDDIPGMDDIDSEDLLDLLEEAVADGTVTKGSPGYGIALSVLAGKWDALTEKQRHIYTQHVQPILKDRVEKLAAQRILGRAPD